MNSAGSIIVMNKPSLEKFESLVDKDGIIIIDSSIIDKDVTRKDIKSFRIPATGIASEMGNMAFANIVLLGKLIAEKSIVSVENFEKALYAVLPERKHSMIPKEMEVLKIGMEYK